MLLTWRIAIAPCKFKENTLVGCEARGTSLSCGSIKNTDPVYGGFAGEFVRNSAQMEWSAAVGDYTFVSDPIATSSSSFAEIGHERNGSFFP